jgi:AraC-like DNA-binding protein
MGALSESGRENVVPTSERSTRKNHFQEKQFDFGLSSRREVPKSFDAFHRHDEIELAFVESGRLSYHLGNQQITLTAGTMILFWGAIPHWLINDEPTTLFHWLTLPLSWFLAANLPERISQAILSGKILIDVNPAKAEYDRARFIQWHLDLANSNSENRTVVLLEAEARIRRFPRSLGESSKIQVTRSRNKRGESHKIGPVEHMASFVAQHYQEPLSMAIIAKHVDLHPDYAALLFKKHYGIGILDYVLRHRVACAQRLLVITEDRIIDIAFKAGFKSMSRFYSAFMLVCGQTPRAYRNKIHFKHEGN